MKNDAKGVITPIVTPINEDETVSEEGLKRVINYVINGGVHGIFPMGSNGEFYAFAKNEYERVIALSVEYADKRVPVLAGASAITTKSTIELAKIAEKPVLIYFQY
jgi:4-hydroxy-tetrahydrodipicolinate synthase